jgi:hypothetical protein
VLAALYPAQKSGLDQVLAAQLAAVPDTPGKQQGIQVGPASPDCSSTSGRPMGPR